MKWYGWAAIASMALSGVFVFVDFSAGLNLASTDLKSSFIMWLWISLVTFATSAIVLALGCGAPGSRIRSNR